MSSTTSYSRDLFVSDRDAATAAFASALSDEEPGAMWRAGWEALASARERAIAARQTVSAVDWRDNEAHLEWAGDTACSMAREALRRGWATHIGAFEGAEKHLVIDTRRPVELWTRGLGAKYPPRMLWTGFPGAIVRIRAGGPESYSAWVHVPVSVG